MKKSVFIDKRGQILIWHVILFAAAFILIILFIVHNNCVISQNELTRAKTSMLYATDVWLKENLFDCKKETGIIGKVVDFFTGILGFDKGFYEFLPDLIFGAFVGLWIFAVWFLASSEKLLSFIPWLGRDYARGQSSLRTSWLALIGSSPWKIVIIAIVYAVIMQIPIVNTFIEIISFKPLLTFKGVWGTILQSFIIAFYIGFLPAGIEAYSKYKIKKRYQEAIIRAKYHDKIVEAMARSRGS